MKRIYSPWYCFFILFCFLFWMMAPPIFGGNIGIFGFDENTTLHICGSPGDCTLIGSVNLIKVWVFGIETDKTITEFSIMVVRNLLSSISLIATIYILYAGFQILVSGENAQQVQGAKKTIQNVILGIIVI